MSRESESVVACISYLSEGAIFMLPILPIDRSLNIVAQIGESLMPFLFVAPFSKYHAANQYQVNVSIFNYLFKDV